MRMRFLLPIFISLFFSLQALGNENSIGHDTRIYGGIHQEQAHSARNAKDPIIKALQVVGELTASFVSVEIAQTYLPPEHLYTKSFFYLLAGACGIKSLWTTSTACTEVSHTTTDLDWNDSIV